MMVDFDLKDAPGRHSVILQFRLMDVLHNEANILC